MGSTLPSKEKEWFEENLVLALQSLYNPTTLRANPLAVLFGSTRQDDYLTTLRDILLDGIESLKPGRSIPRDAHTWRVYTILRRRYSEQIVQEIVAKDMGLSVRQLQREEKAARVELADYLWITFHLETKGNEMHRLMDNQAQPEGVEVPGRDYEIEWLKESIVSKEADITQMVAEVLATAAPILHKNRIDFQQHLASHEMVLFPVDLIRQSLLSTLTVLSKKIPGGQIQIGYEVLPTELSIFIDSTSPHFLLEKERLQTQLVSECEDAVALLKICNSKLTAQHLPGTNTCRTEIRVPLKHQPTVLVVDDNADSLVLMERYLTGSPYHFYGIRNGQQAIHIAEEIQPDVILLDVMMPDQDGWNLLGQLREHPATRHIPVIICTILAQRDLALALGAGDFLRKPVNRQELLVMISHFSANQLTKSG